MLSLRGSPHPGSQTQVSLIEGGLFTVSATKQAEEYFGSLFLLQGISGHRSQIRSPALQVDFLLAELPGKPVHILVISKKKITIVFIYFYF